MVTIGQIKKGLASFVDAEILPAIPAGTLKRTLIGAGVGLYLANLEKALTGLSENALVAALGVVDEHGNVDIDKLAEELKKNMPSEGVKINLDVMGVHLGDMTLHQSDIDTLRHHITSAYA